MRYDVQKYLFIGLDTDREEFFKKAQKLGMVHFIETHEPSVKEVPQEVQQFSHALKILRGLPVQTQVEDVEEGAAEGIVKTILDLKQRLERLDEEKRLLKLEISRIEVFGDFEKADVDFIEQKAGLKLQYFCTKAGNLEGLEIPKELFFAGSEHGLDYFIAVNKESKQYPRLVEIKIERPLGELLKRQKEVLKDIAALQDQLKQYVKYNRFLHHSFISRLNRYNLQTAREYARHTLEGSLFAIEGYVPINKIEQLEELAERLSIHIEEISIDPTDAVPTYLENEGASRIGEDLIDIYDTPSVTDKDPSLWVLVFFSIFFAFIVGDGGYGFFYLGLALYLKYKFPHAPALGRRIINLVIILCVACIGWGFITNSFFGMRIGIDNPLRKVSLVNWLVEQKTAYHMAQHDKTYEGLIKQFPALSQAPDAHTFLQQGSKMEDGEVQHVILAEFSDQILLELALFLGVVHLILSLCRYMNRNWAALGWIIFLIGGYMYFPFYLGVPSVVNYLFGLSPAIAGHIGLYLICIGIPLAVTLSVIRHGLLGLQEVMNVIQVFADTMSYLRLYALGLAGGIVASTMNGLAAGLPWYLGIFLLILAHAINMTLGIMSGVIHGLRLNFLEWYHYSFEGGGKKFKALRMLNLD